MVSKFVATKNIDVAFGQCWFQAHIVARTLLSRKMLLICCWILYLKNREGPRIVDIPTISGPSIWR